jgi:all-trans-retinol dehydrogenase (NAD+)
LLTQWFLLFAGLEETKKQIEELGGTCYIYVCNLCDREDVYKKAALVSKDVGKVSILINNAGVVTGKKFLDTSDQMIQRTMEVNVMSHFWTVKAFLPAMLKENKGHIVSIASLAGHFGVPKLVDYTASKFAAVGFDEALRLELENEGYDIKTTVICPYFIRSTGMFEDVVARFIPTLNPNDVAERVITAMRCDEKIAVIPGYLRILIISKWLFPYKCASMLLRGLVHDASPREMPSPVLTSMTKDEPSESTRLLEHEGGKDQANGSAIHQQLARRVSSSERKP